MPIECSRGSGVIPAPHLVREIRRWDLVGLGINFTVGAGIFGLPSTIYRLAGVGSPLTYVACALAIMPIVLCYAEVGSRFEQTGGPYLYARVAFGRTLGFEVGWLRWTSSIASVSANTNLLADYASYVVPALGMGSGRVALISATIVVLTAVNVIGVRGSARFSNALAVWKLVPLLVLLIMAIPLLDFSRLPASVQPGVRGFWTSVLLLTYAFSGFESIAIPAGESRNPTRDVPFALFMTLALITILYTAIHLVCIGTVVNLEESTRPLADVGTRVAGFAGGVLVSLTVLVSVVGNLHSHMLSMSRIVFAMAEHRQVPTFLSSVHPRFRTPLNSILLSAMLVLIVALSGTFVRLVGISVLTRLMVYGATCAALPRLRHQTDVPPPRFFLPLGANVAILALAVIALLASSGATRDLLVFAAVAAVGLIAYAVLVMAGRW